MSSNNYLLIEKVDNKYRVSDVDADDGGEHLINNGLHYTLEFAIQAANEYKQKYPVEYGLEIRL